MIAAFQPAKAAMNRRTPMHAFKDNLGAAWSVTLDVTQLRAVRAELGLDLLNLAADGAIAQLSSDPIALADCLFVLCRDQAKERRIDDSQFGRRLRGDAIDEATAALLEELCDFFPPSKRAVLSRALTKSRELQPAALAKMVAQIDALTLDDLLEPLPTAHCPLPATPPGSSSTGSPESSDSTPAL